MSDPRTRVGNTANGFSYEEPLLFERSRPGREGYSLPALDVPEVDPASLLPAGALRDDLPTLPELSEVEVVRHFTRLSTWNAAVDLGLYPLGSCTMKYNPKLNERAARLPGFAGAHPLQPVAEQQGFLELCHALENELAEISGMDRVTLQPAAGAQGELAGIMMIRAYHEHRGEERKTILVPDSAHGTNPASAALNGYEVVTIPSGEDGLLHPEAVEAAMGPHVAGLMLTNPSTLGLFEEHIVRICEIVHAGGGLVYGDGANLNALLGVARPGDLGIDVMHINLHKTFSTPHGGGGPGSGPVGVKNILAPYLPTPVVRKLGGAEGEGFTLDYDLPHSIGRLHANFGNVGMFSQDQHVAPGSLFRANVFVGADVGFARSSWASSGAIAQRTASRKTTDRTLQDTGVTTLDVAKRLIDYGYHPPTVYFPLIVHGAIMIEPTESESLEGLDRFSEAMLSIAEEAAEEPDLVRSAPHHTRLSRLDETRAARQPVLRWQPPQRD